ncbi:hypothetical protein TNCV_4070661 [Trichonephila clavipes]|nr:hypothetical protein TNCV_4070661 [Trichonephila clavipes]
MTPPKRGKFPKNIPYHDVFMGTLPSSRRGKRVTLFGGLSSRTPSHDKTSPLLKLTSSERNFEHYTGGRTISLGSVPIFEDYLEWDQLPLPLYLFTNLTRVLTARHSGVTENFWAPGKVRFGAPMLNFTKGPTCVSQTLGPFRNLPPPHDAGVHVTPLARRLFRVPPCRRGPIHLRTSMSFLRFEPKPYSTTASITNHCTG